MTFRIKKYKNLVYRVQSRFLWIFWKDRKYKGSIAWFMEEPEAQECKKKFEAFYNFISLTERKENSLK